MGLYVGALYIAIVLGNHPVSLKQQKIFFESVRQGVTKRKLVDDLRDSTVGFTVSQTEDQPSRVCSPCSHDQVRSTRAGFSFIKASFQESEHDDDSFRCFEKQNVHITSWFRGKVMQWLKCQLLSLLQLDH